MSAPFAVLTFDDGYRDQMVHAVPVLARHQAPFTLYVTPGFAERRARLWWVELEEAVRNADTVDVEIGGTSLSLRAVTPDEKQAAFTQVYQRLEGLLGGGTPARRRSARAGVAVSISARSSTICAWTGTTSRLWPAIRWRRSAPIRSPTRVSPRLSEAEMRTEIGASRSALEDRLARPVVHSGLSGRRRRLRCLARVSRRVGLSASPPP